jgi:hypothetical protein
VIPATGRIKAEIARLLGTSRQAFTPDRSAYLPAILYGAAGALVAALAAELFIRVWRLSARPTAVNFERFLTHGAGNETTLPSIPG